MSETGSTDTRQQTAQVAVRARIEASGKRKRPITTPIEPPGGSTCHFLRD